MPIRKVPSVLRHHFAHLFSHSSKPASRRHCRHYPSLGRKELAAITPGGSLGYLSAIQLAFYHRRRRRLYTTMARSRERGREAAGWERESGRAEQQQNGQRSLTECCEILFRERTTHSAKCPKFPGNEERTCGVRKWREVGVKLQTSDFEHLQWVGRVDTHKSEKLTTTRNLWLLE